MIQSFNYIYVINKNVNICNYFNGFTRQPFRIIELIRTLTLCLNTVNFEKPGERQFD